MNVDHQGSEIVDIERVVAHLVRQPDVVVAYLFGSVARGRADRLSDVDIAILLDEKLDAEQRLEEQLALMADLADCSERDVQIVLLNQAAPLLAYEVITNGTLLYKRSQAERIAFEVKARRVYFDWKPWEDFHTCVLLKDIEEVGLSGRGKRRGRTLEAARRIYQRLEGTTGR